MVKSALRGLRPYWRRISHVTVNISDLERSCTFWETTLGLQRHARTQVASREFRGLGIEQGEFDGWMLWDPAERITSIHLVEWKTPRPFGKPYLHHGHAGWYRFVSMTPDIDAAYETVINAGSKPFFPPAMNTGISLIEGTPPGTFALFCTHDPDGITLEWAGYGASAPRPDVGAVLTKQLLCTVGGNVNDYERYMPFATEVLGMEHLYRLSPSHQYPNHYSPIEELTTFDGGYYSQPFSRTTFPIDILQWKNAAGTPYAEANHIGIQSVAIEVDDIEQAAQILTDPELAESVRPKFVGPLETWDYGAAFGQRKVLCFTDPTGMSYQLISPAEIPAIMKKKQPTPWKP